MSKWVSYGYGPQNDPEAIRVRQEENDLLRQYLPLILANSDRILRTPRYFFCQFDGAFLSSLWLFPGGPIPIGVLLVLWTRGKMIFECPACRGRFHAVGICASILSGSGSVWGPCLDCEQPQFLRLGHLGDVILAINSLLKIHQNEPVIRKGKQARFDWKGGLVGEYTPDEVIAPAVKAVSPASLVQELTGSSTSPDAGGADTVASEPSSLPDPPDRPRGITTPLRIEKRHQ